MAATARRKASAAAPIKRQRVAFAGIASVKAALANVLIGISISAMTAAAARSRKQRVIARHRASHRGSKISASLAK
jgi:hypothetical protein